MPVIPIYGEDMATSGSIRSVRDEGKKKPKNYDYSTSFRCLMLISFYYVICSVLLLCLSNFDSWLGDSDSRR